MSVRLGRVVLNSLLIIFLLFATPAIAERKLFLTCVNGRDLKTNVTSASPYLNVTVDFEAKTLNGFPISRLDNSTIEASGRPIAEHSEFVTLMSVDRISGRMMMSVLVTTDCATAQPGKPAGVCETDLVYDCSSSPPKPKF